MKILQIHTLYRESGGEGVVATAEADLLRRGGHEVVQWTKHNPESSLGAIKAVLLSPHNPASAKEVVAAARAVDPDVIHVHNTWYATSPSIFSALRDACDSRIVMTLHNYRLMCANALLLRDGAPCELCVGSGPWSAVRYGCYRDSRVLSAAAATTIAVNRRRGTWVDNVDRFLAMTEFARSRLIAGGLPADRITVKPNFVPDPGPRAAPPTDSEQLLFVGRLSREKGIATLIEAWERAAPAGYELIVAGDGPQFAELNSRRVPGVTMLGYVDHSRVQELMFASRALLFPSECYEGMPMTLLEAFASGLPVMASDLGSMSEMLEPFEAGWRVTPGSVDDWGTKLSLLADDASVATAGGLARARYEENYGPERALQNLEAVYLA